MHRHAARRDHTVHMAVTRPPPHRPCWQIIKHLIPAILLGGITLEILLSTGSRSPFGVLPLNIDTGRSRRRLPALDLSNSHHAMVCFRAEAATANDGILGALAVQQSVESQPPKESPAATHQFQLVLLGEAVLVGSDGDAGIALQPFSEALWQIAHLLEVELVGAA